MASRLLASVQVLGCAVLQLCAAVAVVPVAFKAVASARNMPVCFTDARLLGSEILSWLHPAPDATDGRANSSIGMKMHRTTHLRPITNANSVVLNSQNKSGSRAHLETFAEIFNCSADLRQPLACRYAAITP